jgi:colanic acid/amylovoran biosynthesis glycosyltransferase
MNEVIVDSENGFLIPIRNPEAIAEALQKVASLSMEDYKKISLAARKTIETQHSYQHMIEDMNTLYATVLNESI